MHAYLAKYLKKMAFKRNRKRSRMVLFQLGIISLFDLDELLLRGILQRQSLYEHTAEYSNSNKPIRLEVKVTLLDTTKKKGSNSIIVKVANAENVVEKMQW